MITKGIIEEIITEYQVRVRIPLYNSIEGTSGGTTTPNLYKATICTLPNTTNPVSVGDVVWVGFEDNDKTRPIILGHLYKENKDQTKLNIQLGNLDVESNTRLNYNTYIGEVKPAELARLKGVKENIQGQIDLLEEKTKNLSPDSDSGYLMLSGGSMTGTINLNSPSDFTGYKSNPTYNNKKIILDTDLNNYYTKTETDDLLNDLLLTMTTIDIQAPPDGLTPCVCDGETDDTATFSTLLAYASNNGYVLVQNGGTLNINTAVTLTDNMRFTMNDGAIKLRYGFTYPAGAQNIHVKLKNVEYSASNTNPILTLGGSDTTTSGCSFSINNLTVKGTSYPKSIISSSGTVKSTSFTIKGVQIPISTQLISMSNTIDNTCSINLHDIDYFIPETFTTTTIYGLVTSQGQQGNISASISSSNINLPADFSKLTQSLNIYLSYGKPTKPLVDLMSSIINGWKSKFNKAFVYVFYFYSSSQTGSVSSSLYDIYLGNTEIEFIDNTSQFCLFYYHYNGVYIYSGEVCNIKVKNGRFNVCYTNNSGNNYGNGSKFLISKSTSATDKQYTISIHDIDIDTTGTGCVNSMITTGSAFSIGATSVSYWGAFYIYNINVRATYFSLLRFGALNETTTSAASALNNSANYNGVGYNIYNINLDLTTTTSNPIVTMSYQYYSNRYNAGAIFISRLEINANLLEGSTGSVYALTCISTIYLAYSCIKNVKVKLNNQSSVNTSTPYVIALPFAGCTLENVYIQYINLETNATYGAVYHTAGNYTTFRNIYCNRSPVLYVNSSSTAVQENIVHDPSLNIIF